MCFKWISNDFNAFLIRPKLWYESSMGKYISLYIKFYCQLHFEHDAHVAQAFTITHMLIHKTKEHFFEVRDEISYW